MKAYKLSGASLEEVRQNVKDYVNGDREQFNVPHISTRVVIVKSSKGRSRGNISSKVNHEILEEQAKEGYL